MEITRISDFLTLAMFPDVEFWSAGIRNPPTMLPHYLDRTAAIAVKDVTEHKAAIDPIATLTTGTPERDRGFRFLSAEQRRPSASGHGPIPHRFFGLMWV
ncbi:MAG: hypothetical protein PHT00_02890 [Candidatus Methanomethylophilus sp.]|nr:hypothetical protein [Methanomethylophilus sp.]